VTAKPKTIRLEDGRLFTGLGAEVRRLVHPSTVGSENVGVSICLMNPGDEIMTHRHDYEEAYYVVRGTGKMYLEGEPQIHLEPGLSVYIPAGQVHGQVNDGTEALHILCSLSPPPTEGAPPELVSVDEDGA
jgi:quercetin dioxygenase-like cupin family protein